MKKLSVEQIKQLHAIMISKTGGADGTRNEKILRSAVASAFDSYFGVEKYPSLEEKAARLCYGIIKNHPFVDGNKRTGVASMVALLRMNGHNVKFRNQEIIDLGLNVASGEWGMRRFWGLLGSLKLNKSRNLLGWFLLIFEKSYDKIVTNYVR